VPRFNSFGLPRRALQRQLCFEAFSIAGDGRNGSLRAALDKADGCIPAIQRAIDFHAVPAFGMTNVIDRHLVVLAPEERHGVEGLTPAQHVARGHLTLTLGHDPVLNANPLAGVRIRPARDIARREDSGHAGFEEFVDRNATVHGESGLLRHRRRRLHAHTHDHEVGVDCRTATERDLSPGE